VVGSRWLLLIAGWALGCRQRADGAMHNENYGVAAAPMQIATLNRHHQRCLSMRKPLWGRINLNLSEREMAAVAPK
jgi:hypothetical protein